LPASRYPNSVACLRIGQSVKHLEYAIHLYLLFALYVAAPPKLYAIKREAGEYGQINFQTLSFPFFDELYDLFYVDGVKRVPATIGERLTPIGLAYWAMDDGSKQGSGFKFATYGFPLEDVQILAKTLKDACFVISVFCTIFSIYSFFYIPFFI